MGASITHATHTGSGAGAGGTIGPEWDAGHTITGLYNRQMVLAMLGGNGSTPSTVGQASSSSGTTLTGTASAGAGTGNASSTKITSAATTSSIAGLTANVSAYIPPLKNLRSPGVSATAMLDFPDASYGSGSTGCRMMFGCTRVMSNALAADNGDASSNNAQGIWFSYSTNRGGNWQIVINSQIGTINTVDTGVAFTPGVWSFTLDFLEGSAAFNWTIRNIGGSSASGTVTSASNAFPVNLTTNYVIAAGLMTLSATARVIGVVRMGVDLLEPV